MLLLSTPSPFKTFRLLTDRYLQSLISPTNDPTEHQRFEMQKWGIDGIS